MIIFILENPRSSLCSTGLLNEGESLTSDNSLYYVTMQTDGNLCMYTTNTAYHAIWCSRTAGKGSGPYMLAVQGDGNLVIYGRTGYIWATMTHGHGTASYCLFFQNDRNLVLYDGNNQALWHSGTHI